jgi:hypothetical protein
VIGVNVKSIGAKAFNGCVKANQVIIKTTSLKKVGKAAFKKLKKKSTFRIKKKVFKKYKKMLKKSGVPKKSKFKKMK